MAQLHFYVPEEIEAEIRRRAQARGVSASRIVAELVTRQLGGDWPAGFFDEVAGGWAGEPLERPEQLPAEERDDLDVPPRH